MEGDDTSSLSDSNSSIPIDLTNQDLRAVESQFVHETYDMIAPHFSHTRYNPWPGVLKFIKAAEPYSTVLDVGCGNGKYLELRKDLLFIGVDRCQGLLECANHKKKSNLITCDCLSLPFQSNIADLTLSIAVIHHLPYAEQRRAAVVELLRCTKSGGKIVVYVWAREQQKFTIGYRNFKSGDVLVPWHVQEKYCKNTSENGSRTLTPSNSKVYRFYHVFTHEEVKDLGASFSNVATVESIEFEANNWILTLIKL
ncbi:methyltransferase domain-containing protein [Babesia ovis]|uniref:Methyltransferase domain-containing protein n=1 Tax=Babesia ovis TaxID=5869 RepID=A0A9W5TDY8_BABOV|nr:methyltransferase domain-containing protein [Babesia ovis]